MGSNRETGGEKEGLGKKPKDSAREREREGGE